MAGNGCPVVAEASGDPVVAKAGHVNGWKWIPSSGGVGPRKWLGGVGPHKWLGVNIQYV